MEIVADQLALRVDRVESSLVRLDRRTKELLEGNGDVADVVVGGELVPVVDSKGNDPLCLRAADVEEQLLVPGGIEVMSDDPRAENLPPARHDNERIHVPSRLEHCNQSASVLDPQRDEALCTHCYSSLGVPWHP